MTTLLSNSSFIVPFFKLLKPRVISLVVFTGIAGLFCSSSSLHPFVSFVYLVCLAFGAGAAGAINMWYDRDIDAIMSRTLNRPIPSGQISPESALDFALIVAFFSVFTLAITTNFLAAAALAFSILYYVVIYTFWLKRTTTHSTLIGGLASSFAPIISSLAVDSSISSSSLILAVIIFFWTPPHFFALSLVNFSDYENAKIPVMPCVYGVKKTKIYSFILSLIVVFVTFLPVLFLKSPVKYALIATFLNFIWIYKSISVLKKEDKVLYRGFFLYSIIYLFAIFFSIMIFSVF